MAVHAEPSPHAFPLWLRIVVAPLSIAVVLLGIWVTGALITNDFRASMALTALWFGAVAVSRRWPELRLAGVARRRRHVRPRRRLPRTHF